MLHNRLKFVLLTLKSVTFIRVWNFLLLWGSFKLSKWKKQPVVWGKPAAASIEPTTSCNLRCPECPSGLRQFSRDTGMLSPHLFEKMLDELSPTLGYLTFYFQGEPYLNPHFLQMVEQAAKRNIITATSTNAHYLTEGMAARTVASGLSRLIISIDGAEQATYSRYRIGGNLQKVLDGTRNILQERQKSGKVTPEITWQFIVFRHNEQEIPKIKALAKQLGVDRLQLKSAQIYNYANGSALIPQNERYARYKKLPNGQYAIKNEMDNSCWRMWHACTITWDGHVVPCCFDKDAKYKMGSLQSLPFHKIWHAEAYQKFRRQLLRARKQIDICQNCTEGGKVWV